MKGPIAYMAQNHVASNIIMLVLVIGGLMIGRNIKQEVFPEFELDMITVTVVYPGATPEEVEDAIIRPIELAVSGIDNIKRVKANAGENAGTVTVEIIEGEDADLVLQDIKSEVDRIRTFPEEAERPVVSKVTNRHEVITLLVYGNASERAMREHAERVRDDLLSKPNITQASLAAARPYEISIDISESNLRKYNLTLNQVAGIIRSSSLDLAGGMIRDDGGEVLIRTTEKRYSGVEFDSVSIFRLPSGERVLLKDIATVNDNFAEVDQEVTFDGKPAVMVRVYRVGNQKPKDISATVNEYVINRNQELPASVQLTVYSDRSEILQQRINLIMKNATLGLVLVLIILALFLEIRLAMWVAAGIAISFLGAMMFMPALDISINMISLFGFLIILGIVVDDAIVVGENIFVHRRRGKSHIQASVDGAREMTKAVTFAGLTTIAAFGPLLFVGGFVGKFMGVVPKIVIVVLLISLIESLFILPSHLSGRFVQTRSRFWSSLESRRSVIDRFVNWLINKTYKNSLVWATNNRYISLSIAVAVLLITIGVFGAGFIKFTFMPEIDADEISVSLMMPPGTPYEETRVHAKRIHAIGEELILASDSNRTDGGSNKEHIFTLIGQQLAGRSGAPHGGSTANFSSNVAQIHLMLDGPETRTVNTAEFATLWRDKVGDIPGVERLTFRSDLMRGGADLEVQLSHSDYGILLEAVERLKGAISLYAGAHEVSDSHSEGKKELKLRLKPDAGSLGITERDLAVQVRSAFFGAEAMRIQRGQNEVKVMVRYPEEDRRSLATIEDMHLRSQSGLEVPFQQAAYVDKGRGYSTITRADRKRVVTVTSKLDKKIANAEEILTDLKEGTLKTLLSDYPGLTYDLEGRSRDQRESMQNIMKAFGFGLFLIFALLAIPFRSFTQPIVVMSAIPFGIVGAVIGHLLLGYNISMISLWGIVALNGVVVNSSLVMIDFINRGRENGMSIKEAVMDSGVRRFRPIIMTSLTTFFGLSPMILETSIQAKFLVPMAVSLGFGVLFSTGITLVLVPALYLILEDIKSLFTRQSEDITEDFEAELT
ncbi:MAG: efflux RND transporter permease subunit [Candidatus Electryonea clarkiae]|nr:efflux RND transporter permease subunit [Candidatus Electryonea clarkiae]MDP8286018.1 efflux RND transporter permease subunit [Candidatus Electryonea clarkiae]